MTTISRTKQPFFFPGRWPIIDRMRKKPRVRHCIWVMLSLVGLHLIVDYTFFSGHTPCLSITSAFEESCGNLISSEYYSHEGNALGGVGEANPETIISEVRGQVASDDLFRSDGRLQNKNGLQCGAVLAGERPSPQRTHVIEQKKRVVTPEDFILMTRDCEAFLRHHKYMDKPVDREELEFPIAYSILVYKEVEQAEQLLRNIYRPHNYYCIHVDRKADDHIYAALKAIAHCLPHVTTLDTRLQVNWGSFTVIEADLLCMRHLLEYKDWRYFINLTGQEFPLRTNWEIVKILKDIRGANFITADTRLHFWRTKYLHLKGSNIAIGRKPPPPVDLTIGKGSNAIAVSREFVNFTINDRIAQEFITWTKDTFIPDETVFSTLSLNPQLGVPGASTNTSLTSATRLKIWNHNTRYPFWYYFDNECRGRYVRQICIFGLGDLPKLATAKQLFANKFMMKFDHSVLNCMEELISNRTQENTQGYFYIDYGFFRNLPYVRDAVIQPTQQ